MRIHESNETGVLVLDKTDSTNTYIKQNRELLSRPFFCVRALEQTAGRGRHDRSWHMDRDDLAFSMVYPFEKYPAARTLDTPKKSGAPGGPAITIVAGLALYETLLNAMPENKNNPHTDPGSPIDREDTNKIRDGLQIKWPNDIYFDRRKMAGILTELLILDGKASAVIGIGINVNGKAHHSHREFHSVSLQEVCAREIDLETLFGSLRENLKTHLTEMRFPFDDAFIETWMRASRSKGKRVESWHRGVAPSGNSIASSNALRIHSLAPDGRLICLDEAGHEIYLEFDEINYPEP